MMSNLGWPITPQDAAEWDTGVEPLLQGGDGVLSDMMEFGELLGGQRVNLFKEVEGLLKSFP